MLRPRILALILMLVALPAISAQAQCSATSWWLWNEFRTHFVQPDGRVLDASTPQLHSSSEGQSYGMFFALIANDPLTFEQMWQWAVNNLAGGNIQRNLPAWHWGKREDGSWGVLDDNSASDADLWFVYALLEAGQRWGNTQYLADARHLLSNIEQQEVVRMPGLGRMLLPGFRGFEQPDKLWVLNPSYLPLPVIRRLQQISEQGPWREVADALPRLMAESSPTRFAPDWIGYRAASPEQGLFVPSPLRGGVGSYDAIRTYLWAGITPPDDPHSAPILASLGAMVAAVAATGLPPEKIEITSGRTENTGPFGFSAALVPYLQAQNKTWLAETQARRALEGIKASLSEERLKVGQPPYYDFVLSLFALGWQEQRYAFRPDGGLVLKWERSCKQVASVD